LVHRKSKKEIHFVGLPSHKNNFSTTGQATNSIQLDWLLLLRFLAAAVVFTMHSGIVLGRDFTFAGAWWGFIAYSPAWWAMTLFFTLSGYLMSKSFVTGHYSSSAEGIMAYLRNRTVRIFPMMITCALFIIVWQSPEFLLDISMWVRLVSLNFDGIGAPGIGAFWSLSTEFQYYLIVPIAFIAIYFGLKRYKPVPFLFLLISAVFLVAFVFRVFEWFHHGSSLAAWSPFVYEPLYANLDAFGFGFLLAASKGFVGDGGKRFLRFAWIPLLVCSYLVYSFFVYPLMGLGKTGQEFRFAVLLPSLNSLLLGLVILGADIYSEHRSYRATRQNHLTRWLLGWAGALTFPVYLLHSSVLYSVKESMSQFTEQFQLAISIIVTLVLAVIIHLSVEAMSTRWRAKKQS
jgi:peptidoglycan/LPS O-acetylase OafA/YrhL